MTSPPFLRKHFHVFSSNGRTPSPRHHTRHHRRRPNRRGCQLDHGRDSTCLRACGYKACCSVSCSSTWSGGGGSSCGDECTHRTKGSPAGQGTENIGGRG